MVHNLVLYNVYAFIKKIEFTRKLDAATNEWYAIKDGGKADLDSQKCYACLEYVLGSRA